MHEARKGSKGDLGWPHGGGGWVASVGRGIGEEDAEDLEDSADLVETRNWAFLEEVALVEPLTFGHVAGFFINSDQVWISMPG